MQQEIIDWFEAEGRDLPWRQPGFTAWGSLVSEFMLQQTPVARVIPKLEEFLQRWPTPAALAASPSGDAVRAWANLGYPRRALWLHQCAVTIVEKFKGEVPRDVEDLLSLPGVGPYTARAVAVFAFGAHEPVVDTNIRRVIARHNQGNADQGPPSTQRDLEAMAALLPSPEKSPAFNAGIMELGALVCTARNPRCDVCPIAHTCAWKNAGYPEHVGPKKTVQKKYEGSDRQARGAVMALLRQAQHTVSSEELQACWPDHAQLGRAITGLLQDGLIELVADDSYQLPA
ncbi:A/G-specific adenine glycosylase [Aurantimicrobium minutum]|uniref:A/G-specific adenine glycosylase n=1 Tax=Aurantimicrobium minutum TaxID=708131 RepID=UPI00248D9A3E|nr:A/G-specific adenine glycosylase [Aurantimicrobium minutum]